jgi:hypothetical protein
MGAELLDVLGDPVTVGQELGEQTAEQRSGEPEADGQGKIQQAFGSAEAETWWRLVRPQRRPFTPRQQQGKQTCDGQCEGDGQGLHAGLRQHLAKLSAEAATPRHRMDEARHDADRHGSQKAADTLQHEIQNDQSAGRDEALRLRGGVLRGGVAGCCWHGVVDTVDHRLEGFLVRDGHIWVCGVLEPALSGDPASWRKSPSSDQGSAAWHKPRQPLRRGCCV